MPQTLNTSRLTLRPFAAGDETWVAPVMANEEVSRWIPLLPHPYTLSDACAFIEKQTGPDADALAVMHGETPIGCITTARELGYWFAQTAWGQGFATEAARAMADRYFEANTDTLQSGYMLGNERSAGVLRKLGFRKTVQVERPSAALNNRMMTIQRMELSATDWRAAS